MVRYAQQFCEYAYCLIFEMSRPIGHEHLRHAEGCTPIDDGARCMLGGRVRSGEKPTIVRVTVAQHERILGAVMAWAQLYVIKLE